MPRHRRRNHRSVQSRIQERLRRWPIHFETRNPTARGWEAWTPERSRKAGVALDGTGFEVFHRVCEVRDETVLFETVYTIESEPEQLRSRSLLRFAPLTKIEVLAATQD